MAVQYWLAKAEPLTDYSWQRLVADTRTTWVGVRNYGARNNLRAMKTGDRVFFYHSTTGKEVMGVMRVVREGFPDPTETDVNPTKGSAWTSVEVVPEFALKTPVTLDQIKAEPRLAEIKLLRQPRHSVVPLTKAEFDLIVKMGGA
jgi:predicted RNA-binding protein with PUA-like domain